MRRRLRVCGCERGKHAQGRGIGRGRRGPLAVQRRVLWGWVWQALHQSVRVQVCSPSPVRHLRNQSVPRPAGRRRRRCRCRQLARLPALTQRSHAAHPAGHVATGGLGHGSQSGRRRRLAQVAIGNDFALLALVRGPPGARCLLCPFTNL